LEFIDWVTSAKKRKLNMMDRHLITKKPQLPNVLNIYLGLSKVQDE
jgi:hypothetical protein